MTDISRRVRTFAILVPTVVFAAACASSSGSPAASPGPAAAAEPEPASPAPAMTLADGVYTAEQATAGQAAFRAVCSECHDAIEFRGADFMFEWEGSTVGRFVRLVSETMPDDNPGSVPLDQVVAVAAYVLQLNDYPVGTSPLTTDIDQLSELRFERPDKTP